jgi:hypothetical protein
MAGNRTIITISDEDKTWLQSYSKVHGISIAEAVCQGIQRLRFEDQRGLYQILGKEHSRCMEKRGWLEISGNDSLSVALITQQLFTIKSTACNTKDFNPQKHDFLEIPYSL